MSTKTKRPATVTTQKVAAAIMGSSFYGPEASGDLLLSSFDEEQRSSLKRVPFSVPTLEACRDSHVLLATPPISVLGIFDLANQYFYEDSSPVHADEEYASADMNVGWSLVRKTPHLHSAFKPWHSQVSLLSRDEYVPSAAVVVYAAVVHCLATEERLFAGSYVRTSDVTWRGARVSVRNFGSWHLTLEKRREVEKKFGPEDMHASGLSFDDDWGGVRCVDFELASARKPE